MKKSTLKLMMMVILTSVFNLGSAMAARDAMKAEGYCSGDIDGRGTEYIKVCARQRALYNLKALCKELNGVLAESDSSNPLWACKTVGDMRKGCQGNAEGICIH